MSKDQNEFMLCFSVVICTQTILHLKSLQNVETFHSGDCSLGGFNEI